MSATATSPPAPRRDLTYIRSKRRRLSDYEAVTCYTQPDPDAWDKEGWFLRTPEGRPAWIRESTKLVHPHWFDFRDPASHWQRTYVRMQAEQERAIERVTDDAAASGALAAMDPAWVTDVIDVHYRVWSYLEYGLFRAFATAQREALSDTLGNALCFEGFDRMRHAQAIVLYLMDLEAAIDGFSDHGAKEHWLGDDCYQPARELVERLIAFDDWAELAVVTNLVLDPLLAEVGLSQLVRHAAPLHGDYVTPMIISTTERDRRRNQAWTAELVRMVTADGLDTAEANRATIQGWLDEWTPGVRRATRAMADRYKLPPIANVDFEVVLATADTAQGQMVGDLGFTPAGGAA